MSGTSSQASDTEGSDEQLWRVILASVAGSSHKRSGKPRQDNSCVNIEMPGSALVASVADGAGSSELSDIGSGISACAATQTASRLLLARTFPLDESELADVLRCAVLAARNELEAEARRQSKALRNFATTLILAIFMPDVAAVAQIGDGAVVTAREDRDYTLFSPPQRGEYANETHFLTVADWQEELQVRVESGSINHLAIFTDGIESLALDSTSGNAPYAPFFDPLFAWSEKQEDEQSAGNTLNVFLSSPRVTARTDDDLTLLLATLRKQSPDKGKTR